MHSVRRLGRAIVRNTPSGAIDRLTVDIAPIDVFWIDLPRIDRQPVDLPRGSVMRMDVPNERPQTCPGASRTFKSVTRLPAIYVRDLNVLGHAYTESSGQ